MARLACGWREFAHDNNLEVGDVCVFVLLEAKMVSFEVSIFRTNENSEPPDSPGELRIILYCFILTRRTMLNLLIF